MGVGQQWVPGAHRDLLTAVTCGGRDQGQPHIRCWAVHTSSMWQQQVTASRDTEQTLVMAQSNRKTTASTEPPPVNYQE